MNFNKHLFEVPYNGDPELIEQLASNEKYRNAIKFIYLPCAFLHGVTTSAGDRAGKGGLNVDYIASSIRLIQDNGFEPCILIQRGGDIKAIDFYMFFGVRCFTIGSDELARKAREKYGDEIYLTASITKLMSHQELLVVKESPYDIWILPYFYNRHLSSVKELPKSTTRLNQGFFSHLCHAIIAERKQK